MENENITAGSYRSNLENTTGAIEKKTKPRNLRRIIVLVICIVVCAASIYIGVSDRSSSLESDYQKYRDTLDRTLLYPELLGYQDTFVLFERHSLGNTVIQSQMGGYFYNDDIISIYPDTDLSGTIIEIDDQKYTLCENYATDINVYNGIVYYRDTKTMHIMAYDPSTKTATHTGIENVGQLSVVDGLMILKDASSGELRCVTQNGNTEVIAEGKVVSFAVAGNDVVYLKTDHKLHSINLSTKKNRLLGNNINSFILDEKLWCQNNTSIFSYSIDGKLMESPEILNVCYRVLGATKDSLIYESENGVCIFNILTKEQALLEANMIFVGASNDGRVFVYQSDLGKYCVVNPEILSSGA